MLWQYQCGREGSLFYYQWGGAERPPSHIVTYCPVCGSKRVEPTGRKFPDIDETGRARPMLARSKSR